jgi:hypothetical protein
MLKQIKTIIFLGVLGITTNAMAGDLKGEYLKVTTYASILGHAQACGLDISEESRSVEKWIDNSFFAEERAAQTLILTNTIQYSDYQQKRGMSRVTCDEALEAFRETKWPLMGRARGLRMGSQPNKHGTAQ